MRHRLKPAATTDYEAALRGRRAAAIVELETMGRQAADRGHARTAALLAQILASVHMDGCDRTIGTLKTVLATLGEERSHIERLSPVVDRTGQTSLF